MANRRIPLLATLAIMAALLVALILATVKACGGKFVYTLDDPYIHLSIAREIAHGRYGIQPGELSAPSSSILWPFLLAPFAATAFFEFVPLLLNFAFCLLATAATVACFGEIFEEDSDRTKPWRIFGWSIATMVAANGLGIALTGMEHSLQVWLTVLTAYGLIRVVRRKSVPRSLPVALAIMPLVRYENLAITLSACAVLWFYGQRRLALASATVPLVAIASFSLFLYSKGLGFLPASVMAKSGFLARLGGVVSGAGSGQPSFIEALTTKLANHHLWPFVLFVPAAILLAFPGRSSQTKPLWAALTFALLAHLVFGEIGWFQRYHVYLIAYGTILLVFLRQSGASVPLPKGRSFAGLALIAFYFGFVGFQSVGASRRSPQNSACIDRQQGQTLRFVRDFYGQPAGVNDIGLVAFKSGQPILDLWGLASRDALRARLNAKEGEDWVKPVVDEHRIGFVAMYESKTWIQTHPKDWILIGKLRLLISPPFMGGRVVSYFATPWGDVEKIREEAHRFAKTLPSGAAFEFAD